MSDRHAIYGASDAVNITPSDSTTFDVTRCLLVGVAGNINVTMESGRTVVLAVPAGYNPLRVTKVLSTSTTATGISAIY